MCCGILAAPGLSCGSNSTSPSATTTTTTSVPAAASGVTLSPTSLTFAPNVTPGATQTVTLTNSGTLPLTIVSIVATGNFVATNDCGVSVAVGAICTITVTFKPVVVGASGTLIVTDDAPGSPQSTSLTGPNVLPPSAILAPTTLTFANQPVGTTSPAQTVTLTNPVNGISLPLAVGAISIAGSDFAVAKNGCQQPIPPGTNCTFSLTFTPDAVGSRSALFSIFDNAVTPSQNVALRGSGQ